MNLSALADDLEHNDSADVLAAPGLKNIKKNEMYTKWRKYVPPVNQTDPIYEHPGEEVLQKIEDKRNGIKKQKAEATPEMDTAPEDAVENTFMKV